MKNFILFLTFFISSNLMAMSLEEYLPSETRYNTTVPTPKVITGVDVGLRHYRHDQIVQYLSVLAASSPKAKIIDYGITNEGRRLVLLFVSSEENIKNFDNLSSRKDLLKVWNGFSVHGNEASGANASVLYAYHLIAGDSESLKETLENTLIIIDPTINPDGYDRYVTQVNSMRGMIDNTDENDASHQEHTPNGRTNHYWFDLNRDWLLLTQVESQARLKKFHKWQPHVLDDHHEMGSDRTFFFQPGVPERTNPLIPEKNIDLTNQLGEFHSKALSAKGVSFYTKESYDDFYPGKGSTYPDLQGSVGILFEQAKAKGGQVQTKEGLRTLSQGISNQFQTALSTLNGSHAIRDQLISYKKQFFENALTKAKNSSFSGYLVNFKGDLYKAKQFVEFLSQHQIESLALTKDLTLNKKTFSQNDSFFIPLQQAQYTLITSLFSTQKSFTDNTFYDVSSWNLPMAWGVEYATVQSRPSTKTINWENGAASNQYSSKAVAYAFNWGTGNTASAINYLHNKELTIKVASKGFVSSVNGQSHKFEPGAVIIPVTEENKSKLLSAIADINQFFNVQSKALLNGLSNKGVDLGSPSITTLKQPKVLMVMGPGINSYQAGSLWHLFDTQANTPITKVTQQQLNSLDLENYTHLIMPSSSYSAITENSIESIMSWVKSGGHIIAIQRAANWSYKNILSKDKEKDDDSSKETTQKSKAPYSQYTSDLAKNTIGGAILAATADLSHPLGFGMKNKTQHALIKGNTVLNKSENPYATPLNTATQALAAGYMSDEKQQIFNDTPLVIAEKLKKGTVIRFGFNPNFRGFWKGTQKWIINAVFFADLIKSTKLN